MSVICVSSDLHVTVFKNKILPLIDLSEKSNQISILESVTIVMSFSGFRYYPSALIKLDEYVREALWETWEVESNEHFSVCLH